MKAKLLRIMRREAEEHISVEYQRYADKAPGTFIVWNGKEAVYVKSFKPEHLNYARFKEEAFNLADKLRRAYILDKLQKLK